MTLNVWEEWCLHVEWVSSPGPPKSRVESSSERSIQWKCFTSLRDRTKASSADRHSVSRARLNRPFQQKPMAQGQPPSHSRKTLDWLNPLQVRVESRSGFGTNTQWSLMWWPGKCISEPSKYRENNDRGPKYFTLKSTASNAPRPHLPWAAVANNCAWLGYKGKTIPGRRGAQLTAY